MTFGSLIATDWTGDVKQVYEKGFGATLGIYNTTTDAYSAGCSVTSTMSRRTAAVSYAAIVTAEKAGDAETKAQALQNQPELLVAGITSAKEATGKVAVAAPAEGAVSAQAPAVEVETGAPTGAPTPAPTPCSA